jgi:hypothetical protein
MPGSSAVPWFSIGVLGAGTILSVVLAGLLFEWDTRAAAPSRKAWLALLGVVPYAAAALLGS